MTPTKVSQSRLLWFCKAMLAQRRQGELTSIFSSILTYLSNSPVEQREVLAQKEKRKLVFPFCCWRFRPSKPYFLWTVKWSVMQVRSTSRCLLNVADQSLALQYAIVKPLLSVVAIILEAFHVYCSISWSFMFGAVYIFIVDFISMSVALYGLVSGSLKRRRRARAREEQI